jgi:nicotinate-nucleotide adenylyltransferase
MQPLGIFGGTFDPIHHGHLRLAEEMAAALNLREVRFVPSGQPPHRPAPRTPPQHRVEMVRRAIAGNPRFVLDEREVRAARVSYTVDTLAELRSEMGPQQPLYVLLGADAFLGLPSWHEWRRLFELAHIGVAQRPGANLLQALPALLQHEVATRGSIEKAPSSAIGGAVADASLSNSLSPAGTISILEMTPLAISAQAIRAALAAQQSVRYLLPDVVLDYLQQQHLYKP